MSRRQAVVAGGVLLLQACDGAATRPAEQSTASRVYYRLEAFNGHRVAFSGYTELGTYLRLDEGALVVRRDSSVSMVVMLQYGTGPGALADGTVAVTGRRHGREIALTLPPSLSVENSVVDGDSILVTTLAAPPGGAPARATYLFRAAPPPSPPVEAGRYVVTAVNGRVGSRILAEITDQGARCVFETPFDSLTLSDGIFFERHYALVTSCSSGTVSRGQWRAVGLYAGTRGWLALRQMDGPDLGRAADSLAVGNRTLDRRFRLPSGDSVVERYTRLE